MHSHRSLSTGKGGVGKGEGGEGWGVGRALGVGRCLIWAAEGGHEGPGSPQ